MPLSNAVESEAILLSVLSLILASYLSRGIGRYIILLSLLPFHSDFLEEPGNISGYDFYNHWGAVPIRLCSILPGLWILVHGKVTRCIFDKNNNTFLVEQKSYLVNQKSEGNLQEISALEIFEAERSAESFFERDDTFTKIQVNLLKHSGEPVSFTFVEQKSSIDRAILQIRNMLSEFLDLPS